MHSPHIQYISVTPRTYYHKARPVSQVEPVTPVHHDHVDLPPPPVEEEEGRRVADIMSTRVLTVKPELPVRQLVRLFRKEKVSGFPVIDAQETLLGLVSQADIVASLTAKREQPASYYQTLFMPGPYEPEQIPEELIVSDIMTPFVYYATEDSTLEEVLELMLEHKIHRVVVTREGRLVGLVSTMDLLKQFYLTLKS